MKEKDGMTPAINLKNGKHSYIQFMISSTKPSSSLFYIWNS
jgi:hypothetical protein